MKIITLTLVLVCMSGLITGNLLKRSSQAASVELHKKTATNDSGEGSIFYLDRHNVDCGAGSALMGFHLFRPNSNQIQYEFDCISTHAVSKNSGSTSKTTSFDITGSNEKKSADYLDRHHVQCGEGHALQSFKLNRSEGGKGNQIQYVYNCVKIKSTECGTLDTPLTSTGEFETFFLDRQYAILKENRVITGFKLSTVRNAGGNSFKYTLNWCKLQDVDSQIKELTTHITELEGRVKKYPDELKSIGLKVNSAEKDVSDTVKAKEALKNSIELSNSEINRSNGVAKQLNANSTSTQNSINDDLQRIEDANKRVSSNRALNAKIQSLISEDEKNVANLSSKLQTTQGSISKYNDDKNAKLKEIQHLNTDKADLERTISEDTTTMHQYSARVEELKKELHILEAKIVDLNLKINTTLPLQIKEINHKADVANAAAKKIDDEITINKELITNIEKNIQKDENNIKLNNEKSLKILAEIDPDIKLIGDINKKIGESRAALSDIQSKIASEQAQLNKLSTSLQNNQNNLNEKENVLNNQKQTLELYIRERTNTQNKQSSDTNALNDARARLDEINKF